MIWKFGNSADGVLDHRAKRCGVEFAEVAVDALDLEAEAGGEVLLVADHHVDVLREPAVDLAARA